MRLPLVVAASACLALSACDAEERAQNAEAAVEQQRTEVDALKKRIDDLEVKVWVLETTKNPYQTAVFDPASNEGYQRLDSTCCSFAVSIESVKPNADGAKVRVNVGNFTSATFRAGTFKIKWGPRRDKATPYSEWQKSINEKDQKFLDDLLPGRWNKVDLVLPGVPPDKLGYLELSLDTSEIRLFTK